MAQETTILPEKEAALRRAWVALQGSSPIAVHVPIIHITGSLKAAIFLSQLVYWTQRGVSIDRNDCWVFKKAKEIFNETGLTRREQDNIKIKLTKMDLLEHKQTRIGMNSGQAFRVNLQKLGQLMADFLQVDLNGESLDLALLRSSAGFTRKLFGQRIAFHRDLIHLTGDVNAAVMLSVAFHQLMNKYNYNNRTTFVSLTINDWQRFTGLSSYEQFHARSKLLHKGIILEKHLQASRRIFTFVDGAQLLKFFNTVLPTKKAEFAINDIVTQKTLKNSQIAGFHTSDCRIPQNSENQALTESKELCHSGLTKLGIRNKQNSELDINQTQNKVSTKLGINGTKLGFLYSNIYYIGEYYRNKDYNYGSHTPIANNVENSKFSVVVVEESSTQKNTDQQKELTESASSPPISSFVQAENNINANLYWPSKFGLAEKLSSLTLFNTLLKTRDSGTMQILLDEIAGQRNVHSPLGLLRKLILSHNEGSFIALVAHKAVENRKIQQMINRQHNEPDMATRRQNKPLGDDEYNQHETKEDIQAIQEKRRLESAKLRENLNKHLAQKRA